MAVKIKLRGQKSSPPARGRGTAKVRLKPKTSTASRNGRKKSKVEISTAKPPPKKKLDVGKIVTPQSDQDQLCRADLYVLTQHLESLKSARTPHETRLLKKLKRWR